MKKKLLVSILMVLGLLFLMGLASCAPGQNSYENNPNADGRVAGFWQGFWHGIISPFTFIISLFSDNVRPYEVHNNGGWYNFGFLLGAGALLGGGSSASRRRH